MTHMQMILYRGFNVLTALGYQEEMPFRSDEIAVSILGNYVKIVVEAYIFGLIFHYLVKPNPEVQANRKRCPSPRRAHIPMLHCVCWTCADALCNRQQLHLRNM